MYPDLIDIGFLHLKTYGALMATGFLACWWLIERLSGRKDLSNLLLALSSAAVLACSVSPLPLWAVVLKYAGTCAVTVTSARAQRRTIARAVMAAP